MKIWVTSGLGARPFGLQSEAGSGPVPLDVVSVESVLPPAGSVPSVPELPLGAPPVLKSMISSVDFSLFPLSNPGIISIPFGFLCGWIGTLISRERDDDKYAELEVRALTGAGAH